MANLFVSMRTAADSARTYQRALEVTQNNLLNSTTTGYARQDTFLTAQSFDDGSGLSGGVSAGSRTSRAEFAETSVQTRNSAKSKLEVVVDSLATISGILDTGQEGGVSQALDDFLSSLTSGDSTSSSDADRATILAQAKSLALSIRDAAESLSDVSSELEQRIKDTVTKINSLAIKLRELAKNHTSEGFSDAGIESQYYATLEELSGLVDFNASWQSDGSVRISLNDGTPLVLGDLQYEMQVGLEQVSSGSTASAAPGVTILVGGADSTSQVVNGELGGLLDVRNRVLPTLIGGGSEVGDLNQLAQSLADRVNSLLGTGAKQLFVYDTTHPASAASSLDVNSSFQVSDLTDSGVEALAAMADDGNTANQIDGLGYEDFVTSVASRIANEYSSAQDESDVQEGLYTQAQNLRENLSGVSLETEAVTLMQLQRSYEAAARVISVLNTLAETTLEIGS